MFRIISVLGIGALLLAGAAAALNNRVERVPGAWELTGQYQMEVLCEGECPLSGAQVFVVDFQNEQTGGFSGHGYPIDAPDQKWEVSGDLNQSDVSMRVRVVATNQAMELVGQLSDDGSMSGAGEGFTWSVAGGVATRDQGTHGQTLKDAENKQEAAQDRTGMPEQSKSNSNE